MILLDLMITMEEHLELDPNCIAENYDLEPASFKNWDIKMYGKGTPYPFILVDNWYLPFEEKSIWSEIEFYERNIFIRESSEGPDATVATHDNNISKAKNKRIFLGKLYRDPSTSHINNCLYKQRSEEFRKLLRDNCAPYYRSFEASNADSSMVSFYSDGDYYYTHYDSPAWTCLIWMVKEPKIFDGGDFELTDINHKIELKNNRMIIFPSCFNHRVHPLKYHDSDNKSFGKYTITHFYLHIPKNFRGGS